MKQAQCDLLYLLFVGLLCISALPKVKCNNARDIVFIMDGSGSIDYYDWSIQKEGIVLALQNRQYVPTDGSVGIAVVQFSDYARVEVPFTIVESEDDVTYISSLILSMIQIEDWTGPGEGIYMAIDELNGSARNNTNQSFCLSTDGEWNGGRSHIEALNAAKNATFELDSFAVVAIEDGIYDETFFKNYYGSLVFGGGSVFVARDATEFATSVGAICFMNKVEAQVELVGLEVTQAIQDLRNKVTLVENKKTLVRAYVQIKANSSETAVLFQARLRARQNGYELAGSPMIPSNGGGYFIAKKSFRREMLDETIYWKLPLTWASGTVEFEVEPVVSNQLECREAAGSIDRDCKADVTFQTSCPFPLKIYKVKYQVVDGNQIKQYEVSDVAFAEQVARFLAIYPIAQTSYPSAGTIDLGDVTEPDGLLILQKLANLRTMAQESSIYHYYAIIPGDDQVSLVVWDNGVKYQILGIAENIPSYLATGMIVPGYGYGRNVMGHEIGHDLSRHHVRSVSNFYCGSPAVSSSAPTFPFYENIQGHQVPTISPLTGVTSDEVMFGWDSNDRSKKELSPIIDPTKTFELMSYCRGREIIARSKWVSNFTYEAVRDYICDQSLWPSQRRLAYGDQCLYRAVMNEMAEIVFLPTYMFYKNWNAPAPNPGSYLFQSIDSDGNVLQEINFSFSMATFEIKDPSLPFLDGLVSGYVEIALPCDDKIDTINIWDDDSNHFQMQRRESQLTVQVVYPNGGEVLSGDSVMITWMWRDFEGGDHAFLVEFSKDGGFTWQLLDSDVKETYLQVSLMDLGQTSIGLIRVQVSDGLNYAQDISDGTFYTPNVPPTVVINSPLEGELYSGVQLVILEASASDKEDGDILDSSLQWWSDVDGNLGVGHELILLASELTEGPHIITADVFDSDGAYTGASISIHILRLYTPPTIPPETAAPSTFDPSTVPPSTISPSTQNPTEMLSLPPCKNKNENCQSKEECCNNFRCYGKKGGSKKCLKCAKKKMICTKTKDCCQKFICDSKRKICVNCKMTTSLCQNGSDCCTKKCRKGRCK